jgi:HAAS domain-containing protein
MTAPHADQLIAGYLARLRIAAADLPANVRDELIDDMRAHIAEARTRESEETDATVLNILDRLGEPAVVVAETRERLGLRVPAPYRPGLLEIAAVILVPFFWPIGVILLWMSPAWHWRDKLIGTLIPPGGYIGLAIFGVIVATAHTGGGTCVTVVEGTGQTIQNGCPAAAGPSALATALSIVAAILIYTLPLITAGYLALRLRWGRRTQLALG